MRPLSSPTQNRRRSRYYVLLVVTLAAVTLITLDARGVVALSSAREGAVDVFAPVRDAARWVTTPVRNAWNGITGYEDLQAENEELRGELEELRGQRWADQDAAEELARLEEQLGITYLDGLDTQIARVTTGPYSNFTDHTLQLEGSVGVMLRDDVVVGAEWRHKPDNLGVTGFEEDAAWDVFAAWFPNRHVNLTVAWLHLGNIATLPRQQGLYVSGQLAF